MMSIDNSLNITHRGRQPDQSKVGLREGQAAKREACSKNGDEGSNQELAPLESPVSQELPLGPAPLRVLLGARLFGASLDRQLADGQSPESSRLLAARAQHIASLSQRRSLAESWLSLLVEAREPFTLINPRVPVVRERIIAAQAQIQALVDALLAPLSTSRGVAMASTLLSDGSGPVFNRECSADLASMLREATARLDPLGA
jgi:hypothetical protein